MDHVHHFSVGAVTPVLSYLIACLGCTLGLFSMQRARAQIGLPKQAWLALGAVSIGGTGIWTMHFVAMMGFSVDGTPIRYDLFRTMISLAVAVGIVWIGLWSVARGKATWPRLIGAGAITGVGVASMHYLGISAMAMNAHVGYDTGLVVLSVVIAVVAATAALWATSNVRGIVATAGAALIMGVAVSGMHYVGMAAMEVGQVTGARASDVQGLEAFSFFGPLAMVLGVLSALSLLAVGIGATEREIAEDQWAEEQLRSLMGDRAKN
ncbi:MHYT domain-containing protein [Actinokineospora auranticolor]|uniref:NO-binding membrane sensor protein with MHYT domain n=1 Tax=Actinokineospora auranticolor TaxID=155976 RepID=A0A2S6H1P4_9PSEU|nr:MHYT domain-containing protein [Actinokineospora auranticolor]PPK71336.1 NO-binding membrane sensor protein with MHYT domain [Actinokineospora auranticolor]